MSTWAKDLPIVTVPQRAEPKPLTFVVPYYENPRFLRQQVAWWSTYPEHLRKQITAIIVDDGSPIRHAADVLRDVAHPFPIRLFRITVDVPWNWIGARNIAMSQAAEGWCLLTDIDHVVPQTTADAVLYGQHDPSVIYGFSRLEHTGQKIHPHPNSWLMTTEMFWRVGGYDETISGAYGSDGDWRRRCAATAPMHILSDRLIRHEYQGDSSTTTYKRKRPEDLAAVRAVVAARGEGWTPKVLSFPYEELACSP